MPQRRYGLIAVVVGLVLAVIVFCVAGGIVVWNVVKLNAGPRPAPLDVVATPAPTATGLCDYAKLSEQPSYAVGTPSETDLLAPSTLRFDTNRGRIDVHADAQNAPCTVNALAYLIGKGYYDGTTCHRLTTAGIFVLQCGDPEGNGTGGPGFQFADENLPAEESGGYPPGTVGVANSGLDTNGSQFFIVYDDSQLAPNYSVIGTLTPASLEVVRKIAAKGTATGESDGRPKSDVTITSATTN